MKYKKLGNSDLKEIESKVSGQKHIENSINSSLKNLGLDYVDLYIYHMWDYNTPLEEIMLGLDNVIKSGKARAIGISNCFAWQLAKANYFARANSLTEFVSMQGHYNLIAREEEREMIPFCKEENIALTPYSALAGGRLAKYRGETSKRLEEDSYAKFKYDKTFELDQLIIDRVVELSKKIWCINDRNFTCLVAYKGNFTNSRCNKGFTGRRNGKSGRLGTFR